MVSTEEVKRYLSQAYYISKRARILAARIAEYRAKAAKQTTAWSDLPGGSKEPTSPQMVWVEKIVMLTDKLCTAEAELIEKEQTAREVIGLLTDEREKALLEDYHLNRLQVSKLALKYHYSERQIMRIRESAYRHLARKISDREELARIVKSASEDVIQCHLKR